MKKFIAAILAAALLVTGIQIPADTQKAEAATITTGSALSLNDICKEEQSILKQRASEGYDSLTDGDDLIVCIDPGHGGSDSGAVGSSKYYEKNLNLKISLYMAAKLEQYSGVKVFFTRTDDTYVGLAERAAIADKYNADVFISIHLNSAAASAKGSEVYYPNSSYKPSLSTKGKTLASNILDKLTSEADTTRRGIYVRNSQTGSTYSDGSISDYYAVIRYTKLRDIPGIIVEGAFVSSTSDQSQFLSSESGLQKLGEADADGVIETYGLQKKSDEESSTIPGYTKIDSVTETGNPHEVAVAWTAAENADSYVIYRKTGSSGTYKQIGTTADTTFTDVNASSNKKYFYTVIAQNGEERADSYDPGVSITASKDPVKIKSVEDTGLGKITVTWSEKTSLPVDGYRIYRRTESETKFTKVADVQGADVTSYTDTTAALNTDYYYKVRYFTTSSAGKTVWGSYSKKLLAEAADTVTLDKPVVNSDGTVSLTWSSMDDTDARYRVYRSVSGTKYKKVATKKGTSYTMKGLTAGNKYYIKMRAYSRASGSVKWTEYSKIYTVTIPETVQTASADTSVVTASDTAVALSLDTALSVSENTTTETQASSSIFSVVTKKASNSSSSSSDKSDSSSSSKSSTKTSFKDGSVTIKKTTDKGIHKVYLTWKKYSGAAGFIVYRRKQGASKWKKVADVVSGRNYTDTTVSRSTVYEYAVVAYKTNKKKKKIYSQVPESSVVTISTDDDLSVISSVKDAGFGSAVIKYSLSGASDDEAVYRIYRKASDEDDFTQIGETDDTSFTDEAVKSGAYYVYRVRVYRQGKSKKYWGTMSEESAFTAAEYQVTLASDAYDRATPASETSINVNWNSLDGADGYRVYREKSDGSWIRIAGARADSFKSKVTTGSSIQFTYEDTGLDRMTSYTYRVCAYKDTDDGKITSSYSSTFSGSTPYTILGTSNTTVAQMAAYFNSRGKAYPASTYKKYGAATIEEFATIVLEVCQQYNVRAEVVFAQICKETGFLQFGGDVKASQCNFAGIGATGGGAKGQDFRDWAEKNYLAYGYTSADEARANAVRVGIICQVVHLMEYAGADNVPANYTQLDCRAFAKTSKYWGSAPYVEWLGIPDNPTGCGWAAANNYGYSLVNDYIKPLKNS